MRNAECGIYSGLHLYEEAVLGFPLPLRERDRVRGKAVATNLLIQTKSAVTCESTPNLFARLFSYVWPYRARMGLQLALSASIALLELLNPWPMKIVIDSVLGNHSLPRTIDALLPMWISLNKSYLLIVAVAAGFGLRLVINGLRIQGTYLSIAMRQRILLALKS